uniref:G_PROTEIN_RECEP_F1_2 domain-containing protein n=1 Tax=Rhabditophanes sp. KR3021 TaxID=114890 RepID=A0AC35UEQ3_9BILA
MFLNINCISLYKYYPINGYIAMTFTQFIFDSVFALFSLVARLELIIMDKYLVYHLVYSYNFDNLGYYGYMAVMFAWYSTCYGNIGLIVIILVMRYFQIVKSKIMTLRHYVYGCMGVLIFPAIVNLNLCAAFDQTLPLDIAYRLKLNGTYQNDLILPNTKSLAMPMNSWKFYSCMTGYIIYLAINYGVVIFTYITFKRFMIQNQESMSSLTRKINIEFNRILLIQCGSPLIVGLPLVVYIASLFTSSTWDEGGTVIVSLLTATPIINSTAFLCFSSKNRIILKTRFENMINTLCLGKINIVQVKPIEASTIFPI